MIWHIFRKDWKLLWWKVLIVEALLASATVADSMKGHFRSTGTTTNVLGMLSYVAGFFLVMELAQLDPLVGAGQDWVARPIRRMDLLLAKVLFLLVAVVPLVLMETAQNMAAGVPLGRSLAGATLDSFSELVSNGLPILAFASLFRNATETIAATFIAVLAKIAIGYVVQGNGNFPLTGAETGSGINWLVDMGESWVYFAGALVVLAIQYFRRKTIRARWVAALVLLITSLAPLLPWQCAFAVEQRLSPMPGAGASVSIFFHPSDGRASRTVSGVCIPVAISGIAAGSWLNFDGVKASMLDGDNVVWSGRLPEFNDSGAPIGTRRIRANLEDATNAGMCQRIDIPQDVLTRYENRLVRVRLDYSLTLFGADISYAMPASDGDQRMPGVGWCKTRVKDGPDQLELGCVGENGPACLRAWTVSATGQRSSAIDYFCKANYDAIRGVDTSQWGSTLNLPAHNGDTLALQTYQPLDHFERQVTTSEIKLKDWLPAGQ
jgi:hypothetical protein